MELGISTLIYALKWQLFLQQQVHSNFMRNFDHLCRQLRGAPTVPDTTLRSSSVEIHSNALAQVLRVDPPTLLTVDTNNGGILLAPITTPMIHECATTFLFELSECNYKLGQAIT
jgi:hypothetical protein